MTALFRVRSPSRPRRSDLHAADENGGLGSDSEIRGLWITRFDWTTAGAPAHPAKIDEIVANAVRAGFNTLLFQVRAAADAFYASRLEPWAQRISGRGLGVAPSPYWDPLSYIVDAAHEAGLKLHASLNVYPAAEGGDACASVPDAAAIPLPLYHRLLAVHGETAGKPNGLQWNSKGEVHCGEYRLASPASEFLQSHLVQVAQRLVLDYDIDGLHLDRVRYGGRDLSLDPVSRRRYLGLAADADPPPVALDAAYKQWQREQVTELVRRIYTEAVLLRPAMWFTAAVWPVHTNEPHMGLPGPSSQGFHDYYQDAKGWLAAGIVDGIAPMIYPSAFHCPDDSYWSQNVWWALADDFLVNSYGRTIFPGIGAGYCTFDEIAARIEMGRILGVGGHALFSYRGLLQSNYFDALAAGPYALPAAAPLPSRPQIANPE